MDWLTQLFDVDWRQIASHLASLAAAYVLALPIAWDREAKTRTAGLRTFPLVAVASAAYMMVGFQLLDSSDAHARIMQGLITGMGFIGGGAILKHGGEVRGTATAASLWATGAIGVAVVAYRIEIAAAVSAITFVTFKLLGKVKHKAMPDD